MEVKRRTRFAPSPTGFMHIGNLRSALYAWLLSKSKGGDFILRIEDTDQERQVEGAVDVIYATLKACGLDHDEGPDIGGPSAPYTQSERLDHYRPYAEKLLEEGKAYRCFCSRETLQSQRGEDGEENRTYGYNRHCRNLSEEEIRRHLEAGDPYVIRQKMPLEGSTAFDDAVFGHIEVNNEDLEDQILLKSDGFPTYNFANVIDDHEMGITHVLRGSEYLSSTPKYNLLYEALGWQPPTYVHLPLILGTDGKKLSKRHGATSFQDLISEGYLPEAIVNYIAFLGWAPGADTREIFTLEELRQAFDEKHISKAPAVFDYQKLRWYNAQYLHAMSEDDFYAWLKPQSDAIFDGQPYDTRILSEILHSRLETGGDLPGLLQFFRKAAPYTPELFFNKKQKLTPDLSAEVLERVISALSSLPLWTRGSVHDTLMELGPKNGWKTGQVMGPPRLALSGLSVTPGGAIELLLILGREESMKRLNDALSFLKTSGAAEETSSEEKA